MNKPYYLPSILVPVLILVNSFFFAEESFAQCVPIQTYTTPSGVQTYTVPNGVTFITVEVWGAGGRGGQRSNDGRGGGGGGGAYSRSVFSVTPGQQFSYSVGFGSNTTAAGGDTWFGSTTTLMAKGGNSAPNNSNSGASGGQAAEGFGDIRFGGGNGRNSSGGGSGGGGSSAGTNSNGNNGGVISGGIAPLGGGAGGIGTNTNDVNGGNGEAPGGGGGGARRDNGTMSGGKGGNGQIIISTCPCFTILDDGSLTGVTVIQFDANCTWEAPEGLLEFDVLVVGGGGGGGYGNGGGGGGGGIVHARANVEARLIEGLPAGTTFEIRVGDGGDGSTDEDNRGENGENTSFNLGGLYEIIAGGGGGGGSENDGDGGNGIESLFNSLTLGFSTEFLIGGSGGGGSDDEDGGDGQNGAGDGGDSDDGNDNDEKGGGGGGGADNDDGQDSDQEEGGNGGDGLSFSSFDISLNRFFGVGGGGGGFDEGGNGGNRISGQSAGGDGGDEDENGQNGNTPGSGGGGGSDNESGGNGARGIVFISYANLRILPVEYVALEAEFVVEERKTEIKWTTSMERGNSHFEVQRSTDGLKSWDVIGNVDGMGWSDAPVDYRFEDVNPSIAGGTIYYRLNQVDFDGTSSLSKVMSVRVPGIQFTEGVWRAYPNPTNGEQLRIGLLDRTQYDNENITFKIIHPTAVSKAVAVSSENEMNEAISQMIGRIPKGVFVVEVSWGQKVEHIKVLKK